MSRRCGVNSAPIEAFTQVVLVGPDGVAWKKKMKTKLECINPILPVRDIKVSLDYYVKVLGFAKADWVTDNSTFALVLRDGFGIYLAEDREHHSRARIWIGAEDIEPIHEEYLASGANIREPPTNYSWAYEMVVEDPDGHTLRIGSDPREGVPFNDSPP